MHDEGSMALLSRQRMLLERFVLRSCILGGTGTEQS